MPPTGASAHLPTTAASASGRAGWTCQNTPGERRHSRPAARWTTGSAVPPRARRRRRRRSPRPRCRARAPRRAPAAAPRPGPAGSRRWAARRGYGARAARPGPPRRRRAARGAASPAARPAAPRPRRPLDPGEPAQLLGQHVRLQRALRGRVDVLQVAAAATARPRPRARRRHPVRGRLQHRHGVGPAERAAGVLVDDGEHPLPRQRVPHEHHAPLRAGDAVPAVSDRADLQLEDAVGPVEVRAVGAARHGRRPDVVAGGGSRRSGGGPCRRRAAPTRTRAGRPPAGSPDAASPPARTSAAATARS